MVIMTSNEASLLAKKSNETPKKSSPLKVVSPIIRKYTGQRKGRIKKKLKFPRLLSKAMNQIKPQLKTILPKTNAGDIIVLESDLLPCALNLKRKIKKPEEMEVAKENNVEQVPETDDKLLDSPTAKENVVSKKAKLITNSMKKKIKYFKNIEATLGLLVPEIIATKDKREDSFAENYLFKIQHRLKGKDEPLFNQFIDLICNFQENGITVIELYKKIRHMFSSYSDLSEDFAAFLTPSQAVECGVFMEHLLLTAMTDFLTMIDIYFSKSPHQIKKIHSVLESLAGKPNITVEDISRGVLPLLKGNSVLMDYFLQLLPDCRPPENFLIDYEEIDYPELNSDVSDDEDVFETIHVPEVEDVFGGDSCPCSCHDGEDEKFKTRTHHCTPCSTKFINGKIFIQCGKLLRPAKIVFEDHDISYHRDRLVPQLYPKRGRKRTRNAALKENLSPTKSCTLSSDEFKSDIEDDEKCKTKGLVKSPRIARKKSVSPKSCDKNIPKALFNELKLDGADPEVKIPPLNFYCDTENKPPDPKVKLEILDIINPDKPFDLPEIDMSEPDVIRKERSKSPPVLSIPDSALLGKPIFSLLENLDDSNNDVKRNLESCSYSLPSLTNDDVKKEEDCDPPWKIEEDRIILQTLQVEESCEETFLKISNKIPNRNVEDIKKRFKKLMNMIYEMKAKTGNG